jgi:putative hydrolase of the HAD superfamily
MPEQTWFIFDLGNVVIKLAYERVIQRLRRHCDLSRDELVEMLEEPGGYRDMERGAVSFWEFYEFLNDKCDYRGSSTEFHETWSDFFDGPIAGIEDLLERVRERYRVAFLSNSNEVHAELIPRKFAALFRKEDRFIFSHRFKAAKPDAEIYRRALEVLGALPHHTIFVDDLIENVLAARAAGMKAFQFRDALSLIRELESEGLL